VEAGLTLNPNPKVRRTAVFIRVNPIICIYACICIRNWVFVEAGLTFNSNPKGRRTAVFIRVKPIIYACIYIRSWVVVEAGLPLLKGNRAGDRKSCVWIYTICIYVCIYGEVLQRSRSKSSPLEKTRSKLANPVELSWGFDRFRPGFLVLTEIC